MMEFGGAGSGIDLDDEDLVPVKDDPDLAAVADAVGAPGLGRAAVNQAEHVFNQQRLVVGKLSREEIEDRYLRLLEENVVLKKHACKQEDKIKKLATKLIRVLSEKKRLEMSGGGVPARQRDFETEELIQEQQHRIRELEREATNLREKLMVARQQLTAGGVKVSSGKRTHTRTLSNTTMVGAAAANKPPSHMSPSPVPVLSSGPPGPLLSQQAQRLLEDARNENRMLEETANTLKEQVNLYEQELEQAKEQFRIKESGMEDEMRSLKTQILDAQRHTATENVQLIQLHKENNLKGAKVQSLQAQVEGLEEDLRKTKIEKDSAQRDVKDLSHQVEEEQKKSIELSKELSENVSSKQALLECEEKMRDLQKENAILRESNNKLLDSAYNLERERQFQATENALKVQVAQLESTLKSDLNDKRNLQDALMREREQYAKLEQELQTLREKYFSMKESVEGQEEKLRFFASENAIDMKDLEDALLLLRHKKDNLKAVPSFLTEVENGNKDLKAELAELQVQYVDAVNELEKTRSLLRVQAEINEEQKKEVDALHKRLQQIKTEYQGQLNETKKLLDLRATRISKLESQLREAAYGNLQKNVLKTGSEQGVMMANETSTHTLFEIHIQRVQLTQEALVTLGIPDPKLFATWTFYDHDMQYTPMAMGPEAIFDSSSYYKVRLEDSLLEYLSSAEVQTDVHLVVANDCKTIAFATIRMNEVMDYPSNKLHGSAILYGGKDQKTVMGTLDYWFKLHTSNTARIEQWIHHKREMERMMQRREQQEALEAEEAARRKREMEAKRPKEPEPLPEPPEEPPKVKPLAPKPRERPRSARPTLISEPKKQQAKEEPKTNGSVKQPAPEKPKRLEPISQKEIKPSKVAVVQEEKLKSPQPVKAKDALKPIGEQTVPKPSPRRVNPPAASAEKKRAPKLEMIQSRTPTATTTTSSTQGEDHEETSSSSSEDESKSEPVEKSQPKAPIEQAPKQVKPIGVPKMQKSHPVEEDRKQVEKDSKTSTKGVVKVIKPPKVIQPVADPEEEKQKEKKEESSESSGSSEDEEDDSSSSDEEESSPSSTASHSEGVRSAGAKTITESKAKAQEAKDSEVDHAKDKEEAEKSEKPATKTSKFMWMLTRSKSFKKEEEAEAQDSGAKSKNTSKSEESESTAEKAKEEPKKKSLLHKLKSFGSKKDLTKTDDKEDPQQATAEKPEDPKEATNKKTKKKQKEDTKVEELEDEKSSSGSEASESEDEDSEPAEDAEDSDEIVEPAAVSRKPRHRQITKVQRGSSTGTESISQDSEGVIVRRSSPATRRASAASLDVFIISIVQFRATSNEANFLHDASVKKLYVEFKFLDLPQDELETPFSLPKPKFGECIVFNFRKVIAVDRATNRTRRRDLAKLLSSQRPTLVFSVVSEPASKGEDCETIGFAEADLTAMSRGGGDLNEVALDVFSTSENSTKPIGVLTVSILGKELVASLRKK